MRPDAYGIVTAYGSPHLARKAEQVPQGLRDTGSSKRICTLCSFVENNFGDVCVRRYIVQEGKEKRLWESVFASVISQTSLVLVPLRFPM